MEEDLNVNLGLKEQRRVVRETTARRSRGSTPPQSPTQTENSYATTRYTHQQYSK